jgi:hypothetical protein
MNASMKALPSASVAKIGVCVVDPAGLPGWIGHEEPGRSTKCGVHLQLLALL